MYVASYNKKKRQNERYAVALNSPHAVNLMHLVGALLRFSIRGRHVEDLTPLKVICSSSDVVQNLYLRAMCYNKRKDYKSEMI